MPAKQRLQAYVDPEIAEEVRRRAEAGHRPESWELEQIIRRGLQATQPSAQEPTA
jgi:hypothetical protein